MSFHVHIGRGGYRRGANGKLYKREKLDSLKKLNKKDLQFIRPYIKKHKKGIISSIFWTLLNTLGGIIPPLLSKFLIDDAIPNQDRQGILLYTQLIIGIYTILFFTQYKRGRITAITAQSVIKDIREGVFEKFLDLDMEYYDENKRGELISVVINDVNSLSRAVTTGIVDLVNDIVSLIGVFITMLILDWELALITYTMIPLILFSVKGFRGKLRKSHFQIREKVAEISANVEENVSGIKVTQSLAVEKRNVQQFNALTMKNFDLRMQATKNFAKMTLVVSLNTYFGMALLIGLGGYRHIVAGMSLGVLIAFIQYTPQFVRPLWNLTNLSNTFLEAGAALIHIKKYMEVPINVPEPKNPVEFTNGVQGEIILENIGFSYTDESFMEGISLTIKPKEKIGLVGETGAGKSTLISLITRLYDVKEGKITIDGIDIRNLHNHDLRSIMGIVSQDVFLFQDTIMNNIRFGKPSADDKDVIEAANLAQSHDFIKKMPEGYNTMLGNQGAGLSGGQRQLIAYARMILAKPKIAILDEATSNIDSYTENIIQENMRELLKDCTTIVIAHRFATLKAVDRLVLIGEGKILDIGTHEELYAKNSYYRQLYEKQYSKY